MALFGKGFSGTTPTDSDFAQHTTDGKDGSAVLRALKASIKAFFGVSFELETGRLPANSFDHNQILEPLDPSPAGTYREATVNSRGQVIRGVRDPNTVAKYRLRAFFSSDLTYTSAIEDKDGEYATEDPATGLLLFGSALDRTSDLVTSSTSFYARRFDFFVPDRVTQLKYYLFQPYAAGAGAKLTGNVIIGTVAVSSGQQVKLFLGDATLPYGGTNVGSRIKVGDYSKNVGMSEDLRYHGPLPDPNESPFGDSRVIHGNSPFANIGKLTTPNYGFCVLEWYEV